MSFNERIKQIKRDNYNTAPVNIEPWVNPFLQLSDNEAYNKLLTSGSLNKSTDSTREQEIINADNNNPLNIINSRNQRIANDNNNNTSLIPTGIPQPSLIPTGITNNNNTSLIPTGITQPSLIPTGIRRSTPPPLIPSIPQSRAETENLARHVMSEVYTAPKNRRNMKGYRLSKSLSTPEHAVYIGNKGRNILLGLRGSVNAIDFYADAIIGLKAVTKVGMPDFLSGALLNRYNRDENVYNAIRSKYPNRKIIMAGHSLGNTLGMNILKNHKNDKNILFYGYNGWVHPDYNKDKRAYSSRQGSDFVSLATPADSDISITGGQAATVATFAAAKIASNIRQGQLQSQLPGLKEVIRGMKQHRDFILEAQQITGNDGNTFPLNGDLEIHYPEYTPLRDVLDETAGTAADYSGVALPHNLLLDTDKVPAFKEFLDNNYENPDTASFNEFVDNHYTDVGDGEGDLLEQYEDYLEDNPIEEYDYDALLADIRNFNKVINTGMHPDLVDVTEEAEDINPYIHDSFTDNIYVSESLQGSEPNLEDPDILKIVNEDNMLNDDIRVHTSTSLENEGTIKLTPFHEVVEGVNQDVEMALSTEMAALAEVNSAIATTSMLMTGIGVVSLVGLAGYFFYQHSAARFKPKNNLFLTPKKPIIRTGL